MGQSYTPWKLENYERHMPDQLTPITGKVSKMNFAMNFAMNFVMNFAMNFAMLHIVSQTFAVSTTGSLSDNSREILLGREPKPGVHPARLVRSDLRCHNGVVHLIDSVIIPEPTSSVIDRSSETLKWLQEATIKENDSIISIDSEHNNSRSIHPLELVLDDEETLEI